ncbi:MAG: Asp-tRNA(Asn)/Glu-tRNA(Gln) amidotransferase subunit GatC [Actinobacteria bacterium]|nr:Asp-tRNA(Asn)/Glu-tRNA(Gln) amidotransferase subunit GatC [Actinomycetota bacterium]
MRLTPEQVGHVARLARLALTPAEMELFAVQLGAVLDHAAAVTALDLEGVEPTAHPIPMQNVLRPDEVRPSLDRQEVLSAAPQAENGRFKVPPVLGGEH